MYGSYANAPPSSVQDLAEVVTNGNRSNFAPENYLQALKTAYAEKKNRAVIMDVLGQRLSQGWPYCYKALDALTTIADIDDLLKVYDKLKALMSKTDAEGHAHIKELVKPLIDKCDKEKAKREEQEANDAQARIWANFSLYNPQAAYAPQMAWGYTPPPQVSWSPGPPPGWQPTVYYPTYRYY